MQYTFLVINSYKQAAFLRGLFLLCILNLGASFKGRIGDFVEVSNSKLACKKHKIPPSLQITLKATPPQKHMSAHRQTRDERWRCEGLNAVLSDYLMFYSPVRKHYSRKRTILQQQQRLTFSTCFFCVMKRADDVSYLHEQGERRYANHTLTGKQDSLS